jgi:anti-sigma B factor antagonist
VPRIETSTRDGVFIVSVTGYFSQDLGPDVRRIFDDQLGKGVKKMVMDLQKCSGIDSSGVGALAIVYMRAKSAGAQLVLAATKGRAMDVLTVSSIIKIFTVFDSVDGAIQSLTETKTP